MPTTTKAKSKVAGRSAAGKNAKASKPVKSVSKTAKIAKPAAPANGGSPLARRLGIQTGHVVVLIDAPSYFPDKLGKLPEGVELRHSAMRGAGFDLAVLFVPNQNTLTRRFSQLAKLMRPAGAVWVAWPSKTSGFSCDVSMEGARGVALKDGLVDNSTHEMDQYWTGARFVAKTSVITEVK
jgi:hypothetical protein